MNHGDAENNLVLCVFCYDRILDDGEPMGYNRIQRGIVRYSAHPLTAAWPYDIIYGLQFG